MFDRTVTAGVVHWTPHPTHDAAHAWVLSWLKTLGIVFLPPGTRISHSTKGNLGEAVAACIGHHLNYDDTHWHTFAINLGACTDSISRPDVDIVWLYLPDSHADLAVLQEVKTTSSADLALADDLTNDYTKLFGNKPSLTLGG